MSDDEKPTYEEMERVVFRCEAALNVLRRHLQQATDALLQQEIENELLKTQIKEASHE